MTPLDRLYVDLDDVIGETAQRLLVLAEQEYGRRVPFEKVTSFDLDAVFGMDAEETAEFYRRSNEADVLSGVALREGAVESLAACRARGIEVWVVTGRPAASGELTRAWLADRGVPHDRLLFVDKYGKMQQEEAFPVDPAGLLSLEELAELEFRAAVEDHLGMARILAGHMRTPVLLMDRPWNRDPEADAHPLITRCRDWQAVLAALGDQVGRRGRGRQPSFQLSLPMPAIPGQPKLRHVGCRWGRVSGGLGQQRSFGKRVGVPGGTRPHPVNPGLLGPGSPPGDQGKTRSSGTVAAGGKGRRPAAGLALLGWSSGARSTAFFPHGSNAVASLSDPGQPEVRPGRQTERMNPCGIG